MLTTVHLQRIEAMPVVRLMYILVCLFLILKICCFANCLFSA